MEHCCSVNVFNRKNNEAYFIIFYEGPVLEGFASSIVYYAIRNTIKFKVFLDENKKYFTRKFLVTPDH